MEEGCSGYGRVKDSVYHRVTTTGEYEGGNVTEEEFKVVCKQK